MTARTYAAIVGDAETVSLAELRELLATGAATVYPGPRRPRAPAWGFWLSEDERYVGFKRGDRKGFTVSAGVALLRTAPPVFDFYNAKRIVKVPSWV